MVWLLPSHVACRDLDQQACDGESTCVFQYFPSSICRNKGCLDFQETDCPSATCVALPAEVGAAYKLCYAKDDNKPCNDPSHSNGNCPQKCTFDFGDGTCRDKLVPTASWHSGRQLRDGESKQG